MPVELLAQITVLIISLPLIGRLNWAYRLLILQVFISLIVDYIAYLVGQQGVSNEIVYNFYIIVEPILLSGVIYFSFDSNRIKTGIRIALYLFVLLTVISFSLQNLLLLNYKLLIAGFFIVSILNLIYIVHPEVNKSVFKNPLMIISIAHIIYFLGITPYFIGREMIIEQNREMATELFNYINKSLMYARYGLVAIAFIAVWRNKIALRAHD